MFDMVRAFGQEELSVKSIPSPTDLLRKSQQTIHKFDTQNNALGLLRFAFNFTFNREETHRYSFIYPPNCN